MTPWHAPPDVLRRYAAGGVDEVTACSLEAHLEGCRVCQEVMAASTDPILTESLWAGIVERVDQPRPRLAERVLQWMGVRQGTARLVAATPALRLAWLAAVMVTVALVVLASDRADTDAPFLALAPLLPLAGVAAAFAPGVDPAGEIGAATPLYGFGLVLRRSEAVLVVSFGILLVGALTLPGFELRDVAWVAPALALSFTTMALSGRLPVVPLASALGISWILGIGLLTYLDGYGPGSGLGDSAAFAAGGQLMFTLVGLVALGAVLRRNELSPIESGV